MSETRTIKIRMATYRRLKVLAAEVGMTLMDLVDRIALDFERSRAETSAPESPDRSRSQPDAENARPL